MTYQCQLEEQSAQTVASIRSRVSIEGLPERVQQNYGALYQYLESLGQNPAGAPFIAYYNMDMQDLDIEIGVPIVGQIAEQGEIQVRTLPSGKVASTLHTGPYPEIASAYQALTEWLEEKGYKPTGVSYEFYLNDPAQTPPAELQTRIVFPLVV